MDALRRSDKKYIYLPRHNTYPGRIVQNSAICTDSRRMSDFEIYVRIWIYVTSDLLRLKYE